MEFQPFHDEFHDRRAVLIPADLDEKTRARFISKITAVVKQQVELASKSDAVLRVTGELREESDRIVIPHEPARAIDAARIESADDKPDIETLWWISETVARALQAAPPGTPHGGITVASLYQDEWGRIKLGDWGIAPAFEAACGVEQRRHVHIDGRVWSLLNEDEARAAGWIAPYFGHEMLEGKQRLNPKSDQFSAGVALYLLGTGVHPYGVGFDDPSLTLYFHLEPYSIGEERSDWAEAFERVEANLGTAADKSITGWSEFVARLLVNDPGERFANPTEAVKAASAFAASALSDAREALADGLRSLENGDVGGLLARTAPLREDGALPPLWQDALSKRLGEIEARKEDIGAAVKLQQRLAEGQEAFNHVEVARAREIAAEVAASPQCDEAMRVVAEELIEFCDEQAAFVESGADELAKAYLDSAADIIEQNRRDDAREILEGVLQDSATPKARAAQARDMLSKLVLAEQRLDQQQAELNGAEGDLRNGRLDAARQRLEALLAANELPRDVTERGRALLGEIDVEQKRRSAHVAALDAARGAWERGDLEALERSLAEVPADLSDPELADVRADLDARRGPLAAARAQLAAARAALAEEDAERGLVLAGQEIDSGQIPQILSDELAALAAQCQEGVDERERIRIEQVLGFLKAAAEACEELQAEECRRRIQREIMPQEGLPENIAREAEALLQKCERIERGLELHEYARSHVADQDFSAAASLLDQLSTEDLPAKFLTAHDCLKNEIENARREHAAGEQNRAASLLKDLEERLARGDLDGIGSALSAVADNEFLSDDQRLGIRNFRASLETQQQILRTIDEAQSALQSAPALIPQMLGKLPAEKPAWAAERVESLTAQAADLLEHRRREEVANAAKALDAAEAALAAGDVDEGRRRLHDATSGLKSDEALADRHQKLDELRSSLEEWIPRVAAVLLPVENGDWAKGLSALDETPAAGTAPEFCRARLAELKTQIDQGVAARRGELDAELAAMDMELREHGRKARRVRRRVESLKADPLSTAPQRDEADELYEQWRRVARPKKSPARYFIGAAVVVIACAAIVLYRSGFFGGDSPPPPAVASAAERNVVTELLPSNTIDDTSAPPTETPDASDDAVHETTTVTSADQSPEETPPALAPEDPPKQAPPAEEEASSEPVPESVATVEESPEEAIPESAASGIEDTPLDLETKPDHTFDAEPEAVPAAPALEEIAAAYVEQVQSLLADDAQAGELTPTDDGRLTIDVEWRERALLPSENLRFDESAGVIEPSATETAAYFKLQVEALRHFDAPVNIESPANLAIVATSPPNITEVDWPLRIVHVSGTARRAEDARPDAAFPFTSRYHDGVVTTDEDTLAAYAKYLARLQAEKARRAIAPITRRLRLPPGLRLKTQDGFSGGPRALYQVRGAHERLFAEIEARWNDTLLRYEIDLEPAFQRLREGTASAAADKTTRRHLTAVWATQRDALTRQVKKSRRDILERCDLLNVTLTEPRLQVPWAVEVELTVGPRDDESRFTIPGRLHMHKGRLVWDRRGDEEAMEALLAQLPEDVQNLDDRLADMAAQAAVDLDEFREILTEVTHAKIERYQAPRYQLSKKYEKHADAEEALVALGAALRDLTAPDAGRDAYPVVFIEYYIAPERVFGLSWHAVTNEAGAIVGASNAAAWIAISTEQLRSFHNPAAFRKAYSSDAELGEQLLGQAFGGALQASNDGSFGVIIAPEGPLWLTRWEQVRFSRRDVHGLDSRGAEEIDQASTLRVLLCEAKIGRNKGGWRRAGLWCVPALAGHWTGPADQIDKFHLGVLASGYDSGTASFKNWGGVTFAAISDPTLAGDFAWIQFARAAKPGEIGHSFWRRGWSDDNWKPTPYTSFSLIQLH